MGITIIKYSFKRYDIVVFNTDGGLKSLGLFNDRPAAERLKHLTIVLGSRSNWWTSF